MKNTRMIRLILMLSRLTSLRWVAVDDLCTEHRVDLRTLTRDIQLIRDLGITLQRMESHVRMTACGRDRLRILMLDSQPVRRMRRHTELL